MADTRNFVLVHGAWHGGWCWARVRDQLHALGHRAFTPTLTGLGDRHHLMSEDLRLDTHIADVANLIHWEDLDRVVLVGHSYAGWIISGVAEKALPRLASIVFLDALMPEDGQDMLNNGPPNAPASIAEAQAAGKISRPAPPAETFKVMRPEDEAWVDAKMTEHPIGVSMSPIHLTGARDQVPNKTFVRSTLFNSPMFLALSGKLTATPGWTTYDVPCGHDIMIDMPERLVEILLEVA
jgi:pimeloyl-ACP methyl ester carboxylesterase